MCQVKRGLKKVPASLKKSVDKCVLCPTRTGAFKPLHDNSGWCHATCAVWIPETGMDDPATMASVVGVDSIEKSRWRLVCELCHVREGACVQCMAHACRYSFHPLCGAAARSSGLVKMEMEAVQVGGSFDVLKLLYCQRHSYLADDEMEKKILVKKWGLESGVRGAEDEAETTAASAATTTPKKRRVLQKMGGKKRGRARKNEDASSSEEEEDLESLGGGGGGGSGGRGRASIDADMSFGDAGGDVSDSDRSMSSLMHGGYESASGSEDEQGRKVHRAKAYMCADCGSMRRNHKCPHAPKKGGGGGGGGGSARKKARTSAPADGELEGYGQEGLMSVDDFQVVNPFPHLWFPSTSTLERVRQADEQDSDCDSVDIESDPVLDRLAAEQKELDDAAEARRARQLEERAKAAAAAAAARQASKTPVKKERALSALQLAKRASLETALNPTARALQNVDPAQLSPAIVNQLMAQARLQYQQANAASGSGSAAAPSDSAAAATAVAAAPVVASVVPTPVTAFAGVTDQSQQAAFQYLVQMQTLQQMMTLAAQQQQQQQQMALANGAGAAVGSGGIPSFLQSPELYQQTLQIFLAQQRAQAAQAAAAQAAAVAESQRVFAERARAREEEKARAREEKAKQKQRDRELRLKMRSEETQAKKAASAASAASALARSASKAGAGAGSAQRKTLSGRKGSSLTSSFSASAGSQLVMLPPGEEAAMKQRLVAFCGAQSARDKLSLLRSSLLEPSLADMRTFALRLLRDYRGLELLRKWLESAGVVVAGAASMKRMAMAKPVGAAATISPAAAGAAQPPATEPAAAATAAATPSVGTEAPAASVDAAGVTQTPTSAAAADTAASEVSGDAPASAPVGALTPLQLNVELMIALLSSIERLSELSSLSQQGGFPQAYAVLQRLSTHDHPRIKEVAARLKAKLPNPFGAPTDARPTSSLSISAAGPSSSSLSSSSSIVAGSGPRPIAIPKKIAAPSTAAGNMVRGAPVPIGRPQQAQSQQAQAQTQQQAQLAQQLRAQQQQQQGGVRPSQMSGPIRPHQPAQRRAPYAPMGASHYHQQQQQQPQQQPAVPWAALPFDDHYDAAPKQSQPHYQQLHQHRPYQQQPPQQQRAHHHQQHAPPQQQHQPMRSDDDYFDQHFSGAPHQQQQHPHPSQGYQQQPQQPYQQQPPPQQPAEPVPAPAPTPAPAPAAAAAAPGGMDVAQLSQWLTAKLGPSAAAPAPAAAAAPIDAASALNALLAKVQGGSAPVAALPAPAPAPAAALPSLAELQQQEAACHSHLHHWDEQYRTLWPQHHAVRQQIDAINASDVIVRMQRMAELQQLQQQVDHFAQLLRQVQQNQAEVKQRLAAVQIQMQLQAQQPQVDPRSVARNRI